jgi:hypothetical protein
MTVVLTGCSSTPASVAPSEFSLGGISVGQHLTSIVALKGKPEKKSETGEGQRLDYPGFYALLGSEGTGIGIWEMESTNRAVCTPAGVCPGLTMKRVKEIYGAPLLAKRPHGTFFEYYAKDSTCWLQLVAAQDMVTAVRVECQP